MVQNGIFGWHIEQCFSMTLTLSMIGTTTAIALIQASFPSSGTPLTAEHNSVLSLLAENLGSEKWLLISAHDYDAARIALRDYVIKRLNLDTIPTGQ